MTVVVTFALEKGGVGKTTLVHHAGCYLAEEGYRVLAIDLDPQGNLTYTFTGRHQDLVKRVIVQEWPIDQVAHAVDGYDGRLHLLGGNKSTGEARLYLASTGSHLDALQTTVAAMRQAEYDFVVVDTPPSAAIDNETGKVLDALIAPMLYASDYVVAPVQLEQLAMAGVAALSTTLIRLRKQGGAATFLAIVPMMFDGRTSEHALNHTALVEAFGKLVYPRVSDAIAVSRCPAYGLPVWKFEPHNQVSQQMREVMERMVQDVKARQQ